jgi:hypothetical protein
LTFISRRLHASFGEQRRQLFGMTRVVFEKVAEPRAVLPGVEMNEGGPVCLDRVVLEPAPDLAAAASRSSRFSASDTPGLTKH